ncbi:hypothetical protein SK128_006886, partial [Halocaridina rubra]
MDASDECDQRNRRVSLDPSMFFMTADSCNDWRQAPPAPFQNTLQRRSFRSLKYRRQRRLSESLSLKNESSNEEETLPSNPLPGTPRETIRGTEIDLHCLTVAQAMAAVDRIVKKKFESLHETDLIIITGKGLHSPSGYGAIRSRIFYHLGKWELTASSDDYNWGMVK